jgi:tetratricopeptide (TPR) repeat protein
VIHPKWRISHAQGYLGLGMVAEAVAELEHLAAPERDALEVLALRVAVLQKRQDWPALAAAAGEFVRRAPEEAAAWVTWAYGTRRADSLAAAEKILVEAEQRHPKEPTIQFNLGCYACQRGDFVEARRRVDRAIALDRKFADAAATDPDLAPLRAAGPDCQSGA